MLTDPPMKDELAIIENLKIKVNYVWIEHWLSNMCVFITNFF